jgi:hypothetical protein
MIEQAMMSKPKKSEEEEEEEDEWLYTIKYLQTHS